MSVKSPVHSATHRRIFAASIVTLLAAAVVWTLMRDKESRLQAEESPPNPTTAPSVENSTLPSARRPASSNTNKTSPLKDLTVSATAPSLSERSKAIEKRALRKLDQLHESLNLTNAQQQRVFSILVRSYDGYDPAMRVSGETGASAITAPNDAIVEVLDPARQEKFELALIDDASWWEATMATIERARADESENAPQNNDETIETNFR